MEGDRFDSGHEAHSGLAIFGSAGGKAEAALADSHRGDPMPARHGCVGLPVQLEVVMGMQINGPRSDDASSSVQLLGSGSPDPATDHRDLPLLDGHIAAVGGQTPSAIYNRTIPDNHVILWHVPSSLSQL